jgi:uncharacterized protein (DUF1810 family)
LLDSWDLERFVDAQRGNYDIALAEIRGGHKQSHWMWYVFPQIAGLGSSPMSKRYALRSADEARAYLAHSVLGPRLHACTTAVLHLRGTSAYEIFGSPDDLKLKSCATLFAHVSAPDSVFHQILVQYFNGELALIVARNWGVLVGLMGALLIYGAYRPEARRLALVVAGTSKLVFAILVLVSGGQYLPFAAIPVGIDLLWVAVFAAYLLVAPVDPRPADGPIVAPAGR